MEKIRTYKTKKRRMECMCCCSRSKAQKWNGEMPILIQKQQKTQSKIIFVNMEEKIMSEIKKSAAELIGETPILEISRYSQSAGVKDATILAKLEYLNPAGSVKDRIALAMIEDQKNPVH